MVYHGPSRGCQACRKRRVKCDEGRPHCGNCVKRKQQHVCVYRNLFDAVHKDGARSMKECSTSTSSSSETDSSDSSRSTASSPQPLIRYSSPSWHSPRSPPPPLAPPAQDPELDSLCFFFNNYVNIPRETQTNNFIQHLLPLWNRAPEDSPLKYATSAAATNLSQLWRIQGPDSNLARLLYGKAITALRQAFQNPNAFGSDELLGTIFMLDFYETLNRRYQHAASIDIHQKAAMAIIRSRGRQNLHTETSKRLFAAMRARYIISRLQARKNVDLEDELMFEDLEIDLPVAKLDLILADVANVIYASRHLLELPLGEAPLVAGSAFPVVGHVPTSNYESTTDDLSFEVLLNYLLELNLRLNAWRQSLPPSWEPYRLPDADSTLHYSIRAVGLYNGLCDVYSSTATAHSHNGWRNTKVLVLRLIKHCLKHLDPNSPSKLIMSGNEIDSQIQTLADDLCASVPFFLGSRTAVSLPHEHQEYPPVPAFIRAAAVYVDSSGQPTEMTDNDHIKAAAAVGGWLVLTPLNVMMRQARAFAPNQLFNTSMRPEPEKLRSGQLEWITGQVRRIHKIYQIPLPPDIGAPGVIQREPLNGWNSMFDNR